ncbi:MAG TPA: hypothetical protein VGN14_14340 [Candidatus Elarobacter sp.]
MTPNVFTRRLFELLAGELRAAEYDADWRDWSLEWPDGESDPTGFGVVDRHCELLFEVRVHPWT